MNTIPNVFGRITLRLICQLLALGLASVFLCCGGGGGDGSGGAGDTSNGDDNSPVCRITEPAENGIFYVGGMIKFSVSCSVLEYDYGTPLRIWSSDLDGQIGTGVSISLNTLNEGTHQITVTVIDGSGAEGTDTIVITINPATNNGNGTVRLPDTGQTTSYTDTYGEDSDYTINPPAYTKLDAYGNGLDDSASDWVMVRDDVTGLIWEVKTDDGSIHDKNNTYTWQDAHDDFIFQLNNESFGGYTDWRLPTIRELSTLVNADNLHPSINKTYFPNTKSLTYWASIPTAFHWNIAWSVSFGNGSVISVTKTHDVRARAVRGSLASSIFVDNGDNTVTDTTTGLMWQKGIGPYMTWEEALIYCESLDLAGHNDWRMPNRNELQSTVDYGEELPAIVETISPTEGEAARSYWTSTTLLQGHTDIPWDDIDLTWVVNVDYGDVTDGEYKYDESWVRCVRDAQ